MTAAFDTNVLVYAQSPGSKADIARALMARGGVLSIQVYNEMVSVLRRKFAVDWEEIRAILVDLRDIFGEPQPITFATHTTALALAEDHNLNISDALIVAVALHAGCDTLWSEDLQNGRSIGALTIRNPFTSTHP